jgi:hypothetical protein
MVFGLFLGAMLGIALTLLGSALFVRYKRRHRRAQVVQENPQAQVVQEIAQANGINDDEGDIWGNTWAFVLAAFLWDFDFFVHVVALCCLFNILYIVFVIFVVLFLNIYLFWIN